VTDRATVPRLRAGDIVTEPATGPERFEVIGPGEMPGWVLLAPCDPVQRANRSRWCCALVDDLEPVQTAPNRQEQLRERLAEAVEALNAENDPAERQLLLLEVAQLRARAGEFDP